MRKTSLLLSFTALAAVAAPVLQMNRAFDALTNLVPLITVKHRFMDPKHERFIAVKIEDLQAAFKTVKHDEVLKQDLFAPSYQLINQNLAVSLDAFKKGKKDFAYWTLREMTSLCLDCHTRLPESHTSSFQNGEYQVNQGKFLVPYNLGVAQLIVRRYADAKQSFARAIDQNIVRKNFKDTMDPLKQILLIEAKVLRNPENLEKELTHYIGKKELPQSIRDTLATWQTRARAWKGASELSGLKDDTKVRQLIDQRLKPLKETLSVFGGHEVDLLISTGLLSNFLFENPESKLAPEISYWLGWAEKYLKRENFFGSGDLFLKQCIQRYPKSPMAPKCLDEYRESVVFEFSGSGGTHIPEDVEAELKRLEQFIKN